MTRSALLHHRPAAPRHEAWPKLTGEARYSGDDWPADTWHAALVTAPVARGRVLALHADAALALPGVHAVQALHELPALRASGVAVPWADGQIHHLGQAVGLVLADTPALAERAAANVRVEVIEPMRQGAAPHSAQAECDPAGWPGDGRLADALPLSLDEAHAPRHAPASAGRVPTDSARGDADAALATAEVQLDLAFRTAAHVHLPMEPHVSLAEWRPAAEPGVPVADPSPSAQPGDVAQAPLDPDRPMHLHLHTSTQAVFATRRVISHMLGLRPERVHVVCRLIGGGFGSKGQLWWPPTAAIAQLALQHGRPVRLALTRAQMFTLVGRRSPTRQRLRLGADPEGRLQALVHEALHETGPQGEYCDATCAATRWLYACPSVRTAHRLARVHAPQAIPMRAPGEGPGLFALEGALDALARRLQIDPLALRLRNLPDRDPHLGLPWSSHGLAACLHQATQAHGWATRRRGLVDGRWRVGHGLASAAYPVYRQACEIELAFAEYGRYTVRCALQDMGSGTFTGLARLAADILGCAPQAIAIELGSSDLPEGPFSGGAQVTGSFAPALAQAARQLRQRLDAGERPRPGQPLLSHARTEAPGPDAPARHSTLALGAVCAEVRVDRWTAEVRVTRLTAAYACGRVIDPVMVRSQAIGGLVGGIGMALHEATLTDPLTGRIVNNDLCGYLVPVHADMPRFEVQFVPDPDDELPEGVKGIGMLGTCGTAAAIAHAVTDATGVEVRELPMRLQHLLAALP